MESLLGNIDFQTRAPGDLRPKYQRVRDHIYSEFRSGRIVAGEALPPEARLSEILGVSRNTLRQALGQLEADGMLERVQGRGTFFTTKPQQEARKKMDAFAFIAPQIREGSYPSLIHGFEQACSAIEHQTTIANSGNDVGRQADLIIRLLDQSIGGVAMVPTTSPATPAYQINLLQKNHVPVVCCHRAVSGASTPSVVFSGHEIGRKAGEALLELGHRRMAFIFSHRYSMVDEREAGFRAAVAAHPDAASCQLQIAAYGSPTTPPDSQAQAALDTLLTELFSKPDHPTAIFCNCLPDAEQVYLRAESLGLSIPRDLSLLYFGSTWSENALGNKISRVAVDEREIGGCAARLLHEMRTGKRAIDDDEQVVFPISLYSGETLGPAPE